MRASARKKRGTEALDQCDEDGQQKCVRGRKTDGVYARRKKQAMLDARKGIKGVNNWF